MRTDWIEDLIALLDSGGVADAARLRNVTQPAFSRRIKVLEDILGMPIIDRSVKPSGPSAVLRNNEADLRRLATELRQLIAQMRQEHATGARQLVIASQHAITTSLGPAIIAALTQARGSPVRLRSANLDECETLLIRRQAEISLTYRIAASASDVLPSFLVEAVIGSDRLIPVCGAQAKDRLDSDLAQGHMPVIAYPADVYLGTILARHVLKPLEDRLALRIVTETGLSTAALQMALSGLGVAWVPETLARPALLRGDLVDRFDDLGGIEMELVARRWSPVSNAEVAAAWAQLTAGGLVDGYPRVTLPKKQAQLPVGNRPVQT